MNRTAFGVLAAAVVFGTLSLPSRARGDWPNFLGPRHDGTSTETGFRRDWQAPPPVLWTAKLGSGFSSFACVGNRLYTCGTRDGKQQIYCLDASNGSEIWAAPIEAAFRERQGGDGPRATPSVSAGHVWVMGARGRVVCVKEEDGSLYWDKQYREPPTWGYSGSVLIEGNLAIVSPGGAAGGLVALDKSTGTEIWAAFKDKGPAGYSTPYPFTFESKRYIAGFLGRFLVVVDPNGREIWSLPWRTSYDVNAASPVVHDGFLFLTSGYNHGSALYRLVATDEGLEGTRVWQNLTVRNKFQSPVLWNGYLYTCDEKSLKCVELETGREAWSKRRHRHGTILIADDTLIYFTEKGELQMGRASPSGFEPLFRAGYFDAPSRCWTTPVLHRGRLYVRDLEEMKCLDLRERDATDGK